MKLKHLFENKNNILSRVNDAIKSKTRDSELEKRIIQSQNPSIAVKYAQHVIEGRWPEAEYFIKTVNNNAYQYAKEVIKGRWPEAESTIMKEPVYAYYYARSIIGDRWPKAERQILSDPKVAIFYAKEVIKGRWKELEDLMEQQVYYDTFYNQYLRNIPAARPISKTDYLRLGNLLILDVPNAITDEQLSRLVSLLFPNATLEDIDVVLNQRQYDESRLNPTFKHNTQEITTKDIRQKNWDYLQFLSNINAAHYYIHIVRLRHSDFE